MNRWPVVALGELLTQERRTETVRVSREYRLLGAHWYAKGLYIKGTKSGAEIRADRLYRVEAGDFIYNRLFAWKGSFALADEDFDGCYVSNEFPCFGVDRSRLDPRYLWLYFSREDAWSDALGLSFGATPTSRNRLKETNFLSMRMRLPPIEEQRRVVERLGRLATSAQSVGALSRRSRDSVEHVWAASSASAFPEPNCTTLGDFAAVQSGYAFKSEWFRPEGIRLVRNVNIGHGVVMWDRQARIDESRREEYTRFELRLGDVLLSLDRPIISTGVKVARVRKVDMPSLLLQRVGRFLIRTPELGPDYLYYWLKSPCFINAIDPGRSNGVPHISPKDVERLPFAAPSLSEQRHLVGRLSRLEHLAHQAASAQSTVASKAAAVVISALHEAFWETA